MTGVDRTELQELFARCPDHIKWNGHRTPEQVLAELQELPPFDRDWYGTEGVVEEFEAEVAEVLGFDAAVFMPSGTMAQQIALRLHTDRAGNAAVALHATSHMLVHEAHAHEWMHGLRTVNLGDPVLPWSATDIESLPEPVGCIAVEVPLRELGGLLPDHSELPSLAPLAHEKGAALHVDGARLWEAAAGYGITPAELAGYFDTVYVSFYKGLGAIAGAALVGDQEFIDAARVWRQRHGGQLVALWPYAASAMQGLRTRLPRMGTYLDMARQIAAGLQAVEGIEVVPAVPETPMMHLYLRVTQDAFTTASADLAREHGVATWTSSSPTTRPEWRMVEMTVGDATVAMGADAVVQAIQTLVEAAMTQ